MPINHIIIAEHLANLGFNQRVTNRHGCWVREDSTIVYYAPNNGQQQTYVICYKHDRWEFTDIKRLNSIIGVIAQKIKSISQ